MYRQPENYNKVKTMRNHFEELNVINTVNEKNKPPSSKLSDINSSTHKKSITVNETSQKFKQRFDSNYPIKLTFDKKKLVREKQNLKLQSVLSHCDTNKNINEKMLKKVVQEDFSDKNKSNLNSVSPLNITKQQNDALKKGCIKRTPAFRKEKAVNNRLKSNEDLNFANIVRLFENVDEKFDLQDYIDKDNKAISLATNCDTSVANISSNQKLTSALNKREYKQNQTVFKDQDVTDKIDNLILRIPDEDSVIHKRQNTVSLVKEIIHNLSVRETETFQKNKSCDKDAAEISNTIPEYAQVIKSKKSSTASDLSDTLKAALKQPLPSGPPPKKPPRTFTHISSSKSSKADDACSKNCDDTQNPKAKINREFCEKLSDTLEHRLTANSPEMPKKLVKIKSDPKLMLQKLESALLSNKIRSPKLPKKIKCSLEKSNKHPISTNSVIHQSALGPNIYVTDTTHKQLFPNCLPSLNCVSKSSSMNNYAKILPVSDSSPTMNAASTKLKHVLEEPIYAEPFNFSATEKSTAVIPFCWSVAMNADTPTSLHYMSNQICEQRCNESQSNANPMERTACDNTKRIVKNSESDLLSRQKLRSNMDNISTPSESDTDSLSSSGEDIQSSIKRKTIKDLILNFEQKQLELETPNILPNVKLKEVPSSQSIIQHEETKENLTKYQEPNQDIKASKTNLCRIQTEKRKKYVRRVCSTLNKRSETDEESLHLFECCLLVGLNVSTLIPYIKKKYPPDIEVPPWVEHLCFPDATEWLVKSSSISNISQDCQCYSLVITNEKGDRKFGYCRRVLPEEASVCLPLAYCIISSFRATGFYHQVLQELESRHGLPVWLQDAFVQELHNCKFPQPGERVKVSCLLRSLVVNSCEEMIKNRQLNTPENIACVKRLLNKNEAAETVAKIRDDNDNLNKTTNSDENDWIILENNDIKSIKPNIIYESLEDLTNEISNQNAFAKINKYSKESRRCISIQNESECGNSDILRLKSGNGSLIFRSHDQHNDRRSEPQINKRSGQIFLDLNVEEDVNSFECRTLSTRDNVNTNANITSDISEPCRSPLLNLPNSQLMHDCLLGDVVLSRPYDSRLEDIDLTTLFDTLNMSTLLKTFGSLLHERKVIFVSSCLSKLSSCIEALQSILYPFSWQHTFIPVLHGNMIDILHAPLPLITGVLSSHLVEKLDFEEGIAVDLDTSVVLCRVGDESHIIPKRLRALLITALQLVTEVTVSQDRSRNVLVSDAFIRMFVEICGSYQQFILCDEHGQKVFEKEKFVKHHNFKCMNFFLEWFAETAMFSAFIQSRLNGKTSESIFEQRCLELNRDKNAVLKRSKVTQKVKHLGHKLKQFSFY